MPAAVFLLVQFCYSSLAVEVYPERSEGRYHLKHSLGRDAAKPLLVPMPLKCWYVYILASLSGTLYVGMTDELRHRIAEHKHGLRDGFTKKHKINRLMYVEVFPNERRAAAREKQLKKYTRAKKIALFKPSNPHWKDLTEELFRAWAMLE